MHHAPAHQEREASVFAIAVPAKHHATGYTSLRASSLEIFDAEKKLQKVKKRLTHDISHDILVLMVML
jgi:hypothetical protein